MKSFTVVSLDGNDIIHRLYEYVKLEVEQYVEQNVELGKSHKEWNLFADFWRITLKIVFLAARTSCLIDCIPGLATFSGYFGRRLYFVRDWRQQIDFTAIMLFYFTNANAKLRATSGLWFVTPRCCLKFALCGKLNAGMCNSDITREAPWSWSNLRQSTQPDAKIKQSYTRADARSILSNTCACTCASMWIENGLAMILAAKR